MTTDNSNRCGNSQRYDEFYRPLYVAIQENVRNETLRGQVTKLLYVSNLTGPSSDSTLIFVV